MSSDSKTAVQSSSSSNCTCCKCERLLKSKAHGDQDICFVEGSVLEKAQSLEQPTVSKTVWSKVKPPSSFGMQQPVVSARRTEIVRSQLTRNSKSKTDDSPTAPQKAKTKSKASHAAKHSMSTVTH